METDETISASDALARSRRIVLKVGSAILTGEGGEARADWLAALADDVAALRARGAEVVIVTSGAIALGRRRLKLEGPLRLDEKQAASAAGQAALVEAWRRAFETHDIPVAQILLTLDDTENRKRYLNARATFRMLLDLGALPLVNENDTIATSEIRYGDNDRLAAHAAQIIGADLMLILSDIDGVYSADPRVNASATHIPFISAVTAEIERAAGGANKTADVGAGGMASKIAATKIAGASGAATIIAAGAIDHPLRAIADGARATFIAPSATMAGARRRWIAGRLKPIGEIIVDDGAAAAIHSGKSILPAGVISVAGDFERGAAIKVLNVNGVVIAQGLAAYNAIEIAAVAGKRSDEIEKILGYRRRPAIIERDDLIVKGARET